MAFLLSLSATFYILHNISAFFLLDMCCKSIALFPLLYIPFDTEILLTVFIIHTYTQKTSAYVFSCDFYGLGSNI